MTQATVNPNLVHALNRIPFLSKTTLPDHALLDGDLANAVRNEFEGKVYNRFTIEQEVMDYVYRFLALQSGTSVAGIIVEVLAGGFMTVWCRAPTGAQALVALCKLGRKKRKPRAKPT